MARVKGMISEAGIDPRGILGVSDHFFGRYDGSSVDSIYGELQTLYGLSIFLCNKYYYMKYILRPISVDILKNICYN